MFTDELDGVIIVGQVVVPGPGAPDHNGIMPAVAADAAVAEEAAQLVLPAAKGQVLQGLDARIGPTDEM